LTVRIGYERPRLWTTFGSKARRPSNRVQQWIADASVVPVHEDGAVATNAEVVASHVHVQQRVTSEVAIGALLREPR
jgi:hypothetical protein